jgi:predicted nucleic acid-binding protein
MTETDAVVVDTDVVSYLFRNAPQASAYRRHMRGQRWVVSFMTVGELEYGALHRSWGGKQRTRLEKHLQRFAICYPDDSMCRLWAWVRESRHRQGRPIGHEDAWIAATALRLRVPLVTNNPGDYRDLRGLTVVAAQH